MLEAFNLYTRVMASHYTCVQMLYISMLFFKILVILDLE